MNLQTQIQTRTPSPPPVRRTHATVTIMKALKALPLNVKLQCNKLIEEQNADRTQRTLDHAYDPANHPNPGSEQASMITIDTNDMHILRSSTVLDSLKAIVPFYLLQRLALLDKSKRKQPEDTVADLNEARDAKRRCMDGASLTLPDAENPAAIDFPQILFDTEAVCAIPLSFFTSSALRTIMDEGPLMSSKRANPLPNQAKGNMVLDIKSLASAFGDELSLSFGQYTQASVNYWKFQRLRDTEGPDGPWSAEWLKHFQFFENQIDSEAYFDGWKHHELALRKERRNRRGKYDPQHYTMLYLQAKNEVKQRAELDKRDKNLLSQLKSAAGFGNNSTNAPTSRFPRFTKPFLSSSSGNSATATCLLCAERGHQVHQHPSSKTKFADGKSFWAIFISGRLRTTDGKDICLSFNIFGRTQCSGSAAHGSNRLHVCSFCGSKAHHAFSWTCRSAPV